MLFKTLKYLWFFLMPFASYSQVVERDLSGTEWLFRKKGDFKWLHAQVPGTVHGDLLRNQLIADPFIGNNEKELQWIENESWEYKLSFEVSKEELGKPMQFLNFSGLDTYAEVYLNDSLIFIADNMFRSWERSVKSLLKEGENNLYVLFTPAVAKAKEDARKLSYTLPGDARVFTRKAQYQYGWDFGPHFVISGIWNKVLLTSYDQAIISDVQYSQDGLNDSIADLIFHFTIHSDVIKTMKLNIALRNESTLQAEWKSQIHKGTNKVSIKYSIKKPVKWWSNGLGEPHLYDFVFTLSDEKNLLDSTSFKIGLRTIELVQNKDSLGTSFYFKLNGVPVFMKGANYIPPNSFLPDVTAKDYDRIVTDAVFANMNMLRVWGGGVYADNAFYDACDAHGILVWQDFMFACAMYPGDKKFADNVSEEITQQLKRLRNHPSIALWCGNNEIMEGWNNWGWQKQYKYSASDSTKIINDYKDLFDNKIKKLITQYDPSRSYWPSSPSIGWGHKESMMQGDAHYWGVWWGNEPFEMYQKKVGRFMSEYGFQGMPAINTFKKMMPGLFANFDSVAFNNHQKHPTGYQTINTYLERDYKIPKDFGNYVYVSQLLQARGMQFAIESHRRAMPYCMGSLYWQLNDCWPAISWSSVDFYGNYKASHYMAQRAFMDVAISIIEKNDSLNITIVSEKPDTLSGSLLIKVFDFNGKIQYQTNLPLKLKPNKSDVYMKLSKQEIIARSVNVNSLVVTAEFRIVNKKYSYNYYFVKPKDLALQKPVITVQKLNDCTYEVTTDKFAKDVFLSITEGEVNMSNNFFDLLPGEMKIVRMNINMDGRKIIIKTLYDSYSK